MDDASSGSRSGNLLIASNDPVTPTRTVALSGTVLGHCRPTLDSLTIVTHDAIGWGAPSSGQFRDTTVRVFNLGFDATRARLHLAGATITGGGGRFTLPGGFTPQLVGATPASLSLRFDEAGATPDSTYTAYLTLACADEALPGAVTHPSLVVRLAARVNHGGTVAVEPLATSLTDRLLPVRPNPVAGRAALGFELARGGDVTLELYDVHGRRVRRIVRGPLEPGRYTYEWNGADDRGAALPAGVYVVRLSAPGGSASRRVALVR